ncbi:hypothetical protein HYT25_02270 [Candidatus Pacearchaeota archaeon]|nr:hypothetical protein [Candidatus Pacearchaeota archaeon]
MKLEDEARFMSNEKLETEISDLRGILTDLKKTFKRFVIGAYIGTPVIALATYLYGSYTKSSFTELDTIAFSAMNLGLFAHLLIGTSHAIRSRENRYNILQSEYNSRLERGIIQESSSPPHPSP